MFGMPQGMEFVILAIIALLVFGGTRLAGAGKNAGRAIREFKEETRAIKADEEAAKEARARQAAERDKVQDEIVEGELLEPRPETEQKPDPQA